MTKQSQADREILKVVGHPEGPRFGFGRNAVKCVEYDEHRQNFLRLGSEWICPLCDHEAGKHDFSESQFADFCEICAD